MRRSRSISLCSVALASILAFGSPLSVCAAEEALDAYTDSSTEDVTYENPSFADLKGGVEAIEGIDLSAYKRIDISSSEDFLTFAENCRVDEWSRDKYVVLNCDLYLTGNKNITIPTFGGVFDGNNHVISGLYETGAGSAVGLFRYIQKSGVVSDLTVKGLVSPEGSATDVGLIAGVNYGLITNCSASGAATGDDEVGGLVGLNETEGRVENCTSYVFVTGTHSSGGIVGNNKGYVIGCENKGSVNVDETDISIDIEDISLESIVKINSASNFASFTDIGGVAGISSGILKDCTNNGAVGYEHVGYNIGGIVGRLAQGYIENCSNSGIILGRKDVGGIAGQMEPFLQVEYLMDGLTRLDDEVNTLINMCDELINDTEKYGNKTAELFADMSDELDKANHIKENMPTNDEDVTPEQLKEQLDAMSDNMLSLSENMQIIADYSDRISSLITSSNSEITGDLKAITAQLSIVNNLASSMRNDILQYEGITLIDKSDEDYEEAEESDEIYETEEPDDSDGTNESEEISNNGVLTGCVNYGQVSADSGVGGIVGRIATEYDVDPEDDIEISGASSLYLNATAKATVRDCINYGYVSSKKDYVGGIAGYVDFGYIIRDVSTGYVTSESGSYVGGIAGVCNSTIKASYCCAKLEGKSYVGGIAGLGKNISDCASYSELLYTGEKIGEIAGSLLDEGTISNNYYVTSKEGGIDGIGYEEGAKPLDYSEFVKLPDLPDIFTEFSLSFVVDGQEIENMKVHYGNSIPDENIPSVPDKDGYYGEWSASDFSFITSNQVYEAVYERWIGSVESDLTTMIDERKKPAVLAIGSFYPEVELIATESNGEYSVSIIYPEEATLARSKGLTEYTGELLIRVASTDTDHAIVEVFDGNSWNKVETQIIGNYLEFSMTAPGTFRTTIVPDYSLYIIIGSIILVVIGLIVLIVLVTRFKKIRHKIAMKKVPKAVIFDLDGTLIDTERFYRKVWPEACAHFGFHMTDEQVLECRSLGRPYAPKKFQEWFGEEFDYDEVRSYRKELFNECIKKEGIILKPGVIELLDDLKDRGITIAVATATDTERARKYLGLAGILEYFDEICSAADVKQGKPAPDVYLKACRQLKLRPECCFAVEDAPNGIKSAAAAGCRVIFVPDQTYDEPEVEDLLFAKADRADKIINTIAELAQ